METILHKHDTRLNTRVSFEDSIPNFQYNFFFKVSLIVPVIANAVLYWTVSILPDKQELLGWP